MRTKIKKRSPNAKRPPRGRREFGNRRKSVPTPPDLVEMRSWTGKRGITRALVLLTLLNELLEPAGLQQWLETPNSSLRRASPVDLLESGNWTVLADLIDDMLTGAPG